MNEKIFVLFGGSSEERLVSVASAQNLAAQLPGATLWFLATDGKVFETTQEKLLAHQNPFTQTFLPAAQPLFPSLQKALSAIKALRPIFFLALHGGEGEDGSLQQLFENEKIAFTGSGSRASHLAFEKQLAKEIARKIQVRVAESQSFSTGAPLDNRKTLTDFFRANGACVCKPLAGGSSIGLFFVHADKDIVATADSLGKMPGREYLLETFVEGRELTIGVMDDGTSLKALPASEIKIDPHRQFDYEGKYLGKGTLEITPAEIPTDVLHQVQDIAVKMHQALGCEGYTRTDLILTDEGPVYLETNTLPGLTKASFIPQQLAVAHVPFLDFLKSQLELAKKRTYS